jgi:hypothetical protein
METLGVGTPKKRYKRAVLKSARRYAREGVKTTEKCVHIGNLLIFVRTYRSEAFHIELTFLEPTTTQN